LRAAATATGGGHPALGALTVLIAKPIAIIVLHLGVADFLPNRIHQSVRIVAVQGVGNGVRRLVAAEDESRRSAEPVSVFVEVPPTLDAGVCCSSVERHLTRVDTGWRVGALPCRGVAGHAARLAIVEDDLAAAAQGLHESEGRAPQREAAT
jgi:hypothetical protein